MTKEQAEKIWNRLYKKAHTYYDKNGIPREAERKKDWLKMQAFTKDNFVLLTSPYDKEVN